jgi:hypothetical protein
MDPMIRLHSWQPLNPLKPETSPYLEHSGMDFSGHIAALRN